MIKTIALLALAALLSLGCITPPAESCDPHTWLTYSTAPTAAEGAYTPFAHPQAIAGRLAPVDHAREILTLALGEAPGWGCASPATVWAAVLPALPPGGPGEALGELAVLDRGDMGEGFVLGLVSLDEPVVVDPGAAPWIVMGIEGAECGAKAQLVTAEPRGAHWTAGGGWAEVDAQLVMGAGGCAR